MTWQTLRDLDKRRPFAPYSVRLNSGDMIRIEKAEHCLITEDRQTLVYNRSGGELQFIAIANIAMVE